MSPEGNVGVEVDELEQALFGLELFAFLTALEFDAELGLFIASLVFGVDSGELGVCGHERGRNVVGEQSGVRVDVEEPNDIFGSDYAVLGVI